METLEGNSWCGRNDPWTTRKFRFDTFVSFLEWQPLFRVRGAQGGQQDGQPVPRVRRTGAGPAGHGHRQLCRQSPHDVIDRFGQSQDRLMGLQPSNGSRPRACT